MDLRDLSIIEVEPVHVGRDRTTATWPCASCGEWHDVAAGYAVHHNENGRMRTTFVCPRCARPYFDGTSES